MRMAKVFILMFAVTVLLTAFPCQAGEKKPFNSMVVWEGEIDPGVTTYSGKMIHVRNASYIFSHDSSDDRLDGTGISVFNANMDETGSGPIWGTYQVFDDVSGDVVWEASWQGKIYNYSFYQINWIVEMEMHGVGQYEGLTVRGTQTFDTDIFSYPFIGYDVGVIQSNGDQ